MDTEKFVILNIQSWMLICFKLLWLFRLLCLANFFISFGLHTSVTIVRQSCLFRLLNSLNCIYRENSEVGDEVLCFIFLFAMRIAPHRFGSMVWCDWPALDGYINRSIYKPLVRHQRTKKKEKYLATTFLSYIHLKNSMCLYQDELHEWFALTSRCIQHPMYMQVDRQGDMLASVTYGTTMKINQQWLNIGRTGDSIFNEED